MADAGPLNVQQLLIRVFFLFFLMFILLLVLTWTNTLKCSVVGDDWCGFYYFLGNPDVLVVYGEDGLGDPFLLQSQFFDREKGVGIRPELLQLERIALGNLKPYELVIVTRAKTMSTEQMKMFIDYANQGGRLIWTGDAGTALPISIQPGTFVNRADLNESAESNLLYKDEVRGASDKNNHVPIGPWARKLDGKIVRLDDLIAVQYVNNYCNLKPCTFTSTPQSINTSTSELCPAVLNAVNNNSRFVYAFKPNLPFCFFPSQDFSIVQLLPGKTATSILTADFPGNIIVEGRNYGRSQPLIVSAAKSSLFGTNIGENTAYYALPLEYFARPDLPKNLQYHAVLVNAYKAMLYG